MKPLKILAIAKNLSTLNDQLDSVAIACGAVGSRLVKSAIANDGHVHIDQEDLVLAIETSDGEDAITDNFNLIDEDIQRPLIYSLLKTYKNQ